MRPAGRRWIAHLLLLLYIVTTTFYSGSTPPAPFVIAILALFGIGAGSQVYRYRRVSTPLERQQTKWVMFAMLLVFTNLLVSASPMAFPEILRPGSPLNPLALVIGNLPSLIIPLIPLSFAFAIFRYHLWDIDLVIRRTLLYSILTALIGLVYFGLVTLLQALFAGATGQTSPLALVISTLAIAALFNPLRRRLQAWIDRRFFRQRYDGEQALAAFSASARQETDLNRLSGSLVHSVQQSIQPESIALWLRPQALRLPARREKEF